MNIETVNELIQSLESAGELSIRETKVVALAKAYQQLAAENVALKNLARGWANATDDRLFEEFGEISHDSIDDCEAELKIICPATDRIVAGIKADGVALVKSAFEMHIQSASCYQDEIVGMESAMSIACQVESQLREGADK
ncbi:hypothetical protein ACKLK7_11325 [Klebsiella quasipneumoniae subsp. similipneumoniae]|uniref:hypothetical protein n=1 Tax=Klebsiella pneumoniae complex TaxID=3390273 RepID=UPI000B41244D|nr:MULTISPECIES: hypothetical protein [Klebsiella]AXT65085.1 hypothetical protein CN260_07115 [Klebsiella pneumoniae]AZJ03773.1 hypothetical protein BME54_07680 [Klebsiella quasipneumoniae]MDH2693426.1 hypothetical protein [Klebsiella quasipneumoniae]OVW11078.1 hypothetical protein BME61_05420 [Klebsiella quasipneumoniae subsp. similipneumoniae]OVW15582.1 hypothetical protein BME56_29765 [Klebsiella quasipneumoniae subsp. similipneumoniae]